MTDIANSPNRDRFLMLAQHRVGSAVDKIRVFSNLANPGYPWTAEEIEDYLGQIEESIQEARERFRKNKQWVEPANTETPASDAPSPDLKPSAAQAPSPALLKLLAKAPDPHHVYTLTETMQLAAIDGRVLEDQIALLKTVIDAQEKELTELRERTK